MSKKVFTNAHVSLNAVNLSSRVKSVTLKYGAEVVDTTTMSEASRTKLPGLKDWSLEIEFGQDYDNGWVDDTLFPLVGTVIAVILRPDAGAKAAGNPEYTGNVVLSDYSPIAGSIGAALTAPVSLQGTGVLARAIA